MPAAALLDEQPSRNWWSGLAKSHSPKDVRDPYGPEKQEARTRKRSQTATKSSPFGSLASVIGLKSKKHHPALAIQQPDSLFDSATSNPVSPTSNPRPPSKAASSTRSRVDSIEPKTPVDFQRDRRHSLLTLSDTDPFAGRPIITVPVPHIPNDPNRLSAYSNNSATDFPQKKAEPPIFNRVSYASSSSHSNHHVVDLLPSSPISPSTEPLRLQSKRSIGSLQTRRINGNTDTLSRQTSVTPSTTSLLGSVTKSPSKVRPSTAESTFTRPGTRARGMTDGAVRQRAGFFVDTGVGARPDKPPQKSISATNSPIISDHPSASAFTTSPRVVVRQASVSHLQSPPTAPPTHSLPATPLPAPEGPIPHKRVGLVPKAQSASSSRLSFASSISLASDMFGPPSTFPRDIDKRFSGRSILSHQTADIVDPDMSSLPPRDSKSTPGSPRSLKKVSSHQTLKRGHTSPSPTVAPKSPQPPGERVFRKQRSFHRVPIPPLPLPYFSTNSTAFPSLNDPGPTSPEQKRGSGHSSLGRKRLFSNSSHNRPSTSSNVVASEDDKQSVFSLRSEHDFGGTSYKPWATTTNHTYANSSFWDEGIPDAIPGSPTRSNVDYTPQAILSPADLAKLEASVEERSTRSRGFSLLSASTVMSDLDLEPDYNPIGLSPPPPPSSRPPTGNQGLSKSSTQPVVQHHTTSSHPPEDLYSFDSTLRLANKEQTPHPTHSSLSSSASASTIGPRVSSPSFATSLPPPPRPRQRGTLTLASEKLPIQATSRAPSIRRAPSTRTKSSMEKNLHRRSIMRKPSFLDIDDDTDQESDSDFIAERTSSFLDMARESFDTARDGV
ncbi:hypothetical protein CVT24_009050 [Panaeolus cyanescens]|uniref:Uncharacterized protein n=1 Tax=Panaeolus cyanescens TaxID=181874 RepID=A0A409YAM1_9AGAR|nr:hypothetical protein CVT24_009050 [Panaeolus cyanescens]